MSSSNGQQVVIGEGIGFGRLGVSGGEGRSEELELQVELTDAGGLKAVPTRAGEEVDRVIGASDLMLVVGRPASQVGEGDVFVWVAEHDGQKIVGQTAAAGSGCITLTDQRLLGLVFAADVDAPSLRVTMDENGDGELVVFVVDRPQISDLTTNKSFTGQLRSAKLSGACELEFATDKVLSPRGEYTKPARGEIESVLERFAGGG